MQIFDSTNCGSQETHSVVGFWPNMNHLLICCLFWELWGHSGNFAEPNIVLGWQKCFSFVSWTTFPAKFKILSQFLLNSGFPDMYCLHLADRNWLMFELYRGSRKTTVVNLFEIRLYDRISTDLPWPRQLSDLRKATGKISFFFLCNFWKLCVTAHYFFTRRLVFAGDMWQTSHGDSQT